jgi:hypothetical protein
VAVPHTGRVKRPRIVLAGVALVLLATACGGEDKPSADATPEVTSTSSATPGAKPGGASASPTAKPGQATTRPSAGGQPSGGTSGAVATTTGGGTSTTTGGAGAAQTSTKPGSYTYDLKGKAAGPDGRSQDVSGSSTLTVEAAVGNKQRSSMSSDQGKTEQDLVHSSGTKIARLKVTSPLMNIEFRPASPVLAVPQPAPVGRTWSWTMKSTDGKTKADFRGKILGTETVTIGGVRVDTVVFESTLTLSGNINGAPYTYTQKSRSNYDAKRLLRVKERSQLTVTYSGAPAGSGDTTSTLRSVNPR